MKWKTKQANLAERQIIIMKDDETHPTKCALGKIIRTHSGSDGHFF